MARKKYEEVKKYWVYSIQIPSVNKYYIGVSKQKCSQRWQKANYKGTALEPYFSEWDNLIKTVLVGNLTKEEALKYEDNIIQALSMNNLCVNSNRSGLITNDINTYQKEYRKENNTEYQEYQKQYREDNKEQIREYHKQYNENPEYRERNNQRSKQWQKDNKEQYNEYQREYQRQRRLKRKLEKQNQQLNLI